MKKHNHHIKNLFAARAAAPRLQANNDGGKLELMLYGDIGDDWFGIGPTSVAEQINAAGDISEITVRINSRGGDVFDGAAIYNLLVSQGVPVNVVIDGLAASAASYIAMAGKTVTMGEGAMIMIHNPYCFALGNATELRKTADMLDKVRDSMLSGYMKRYNGTEDELKAALDAETWMTAADAKEAGLCDEIAGAKDDEDPKDLFAAFDLSIFRNVPKNLKDQKKRPAAAATSCQCSCGPCRDGNCASCSDPDCNYPDCQDCMQQANASAFLEHSHMRLKLHERLARR